MIRVYIETYGCSSNQADSEILAGILKQNGFDVVNSLENSDLNILNSCNVKSVTSNRMIHRIKELTKLNKPMIVAGCMTKTERHVIEKINSRASMLGPDSISKIVDVARVTLSGRKVVFTKDLRKPKTCLPRVRRNDVIHITPISVGCTSSCSYCITRLARGRLFSYSVDTILKDIKKGLKEGCKEVWITSQDCGCWGVDLGSNLSDLLNAIDGIEGKFLVRVGMMNPTHVKNFVEDLINSFRSRKIFKFLHLPVQSGSDRILERMNRNYTIDDFRQIVKKFRREFPLLTLSTDIIVGFPNEKKVDFQRTINLIMEVKPDIVNISKFGLRPGTKAAEMEQLPRETINARTKKLAKLVEGVKLKNNQKWLDWEGEALIDEVGRKGGFIGRNFAYKPILTEGKIGTFRKVKIKSVRPTYLIAEQLK